MNYKNTNIYKHNDYILDYKKFIPNNAKILILGSFPSRCSKRMQFYYASCTNAFWCEYLGADKTPDTPDEAAKICSDNKVALYDVIEEALLDENRTCKDPKIKNIKRYATEQIDKILEAHADIKDVFIMSIYATKIFKRHILKELKFIEGKNIHYNLASSSGSFLRGGKSRKNNKEFKNLKQLLKNKELSR